MKTKVTDLLSIELPIIQGGLAHLAYADLAAAVSNAGGLGQITAMSLPNEDALRQEIHKVRELTDRPFGVNFAIGQHGRPFENMVQVAVDELVPVISVTGGNPKPVLDMFEGTNTKKLVLVAAKRQAIKAEELGADAVMVVGHEGGGHLGKDDIGTFVLTPEVVDAVQIPVIASGGISDGRGLMAALALGADGIEMGTRFIATQECIHAHKSYKQTLLNADEKSTVMIKKSIGAPARALRNQWTDQILELEEQEAGYEGLKDYISGEANKRYIHEGKHDEGFAWAGQVAMRINHIPTVKELFESIKQEISTIQNKWTAL
ncbi:NAD(P)H-dependent flavin oxidoreductase [Tenuibacillus multivorans]|uniref:Probable nitronate monooxygenase n=1 Tax=Tenuibacillus multivorans TaxID=237069 RepID=A0A1G9YB95_9BACI|nr:nitronate monooxygenase family protein [Tenuibacillus multivorans]GEL76028.1 enoyl-ACP reductase II [Tenuibacillus multivorans]SDN06399.1 enoyl-[acyl-carrier protein] reductase II [Tenuibacillus multivorans]